MIKRLWYFSLEVMEKLDRRKTFLERHGYKFARKIYDRAYKISLSLNLRTLKR